MRGGRRSGAGRPKGAATKRTREIADRAATEGVLPLEYMLGVMRDGSAEPSRRDDMAKAAAPYVHARLSATKVEIKRPEDMTDDELAAALAVAERIAFGDGEAVGAATPPGASPTRH